MSDSINKTINIDVNVENQNLDKAAQGVEKVTKATENHTDSLKENKKGVLENGGAMGLLGAATGGLAMDFKDAIEAIELTGVSLKGLRGALIATGIGALAIILLELVTNWDKWSGVIDGSTAATERLNNELSILTNQQELLNSAQETGISLSEAWGLSEEEVYKEKKKNNDDLINEYNKQIAVLKNLMVVEQNRWSTDWEKYKEYKDKIKALDALSQKASDANLILNAQNETRKRKEKSDAEKEALEKRVKAEKEANDKLTAFLKERTETNIKDLQLLIDGFQKIGQAVKDLDAAKYGAIYGELVKIDALFIEGRNKIIAAEEALEKIQKQKEYASKGELETLNKKQTALENQLKIEGENFTKYILPRLTMESKIAMENATKRAETSKKQGKSYEENNRLLKEEAQLSAFMAKDDFLKAKNLDYYVERNRDINKIYDIRTSIIKNNAADELNNVNNIVKGYLDQEKSLLKSKETFLGLNEIIQEAQSQGMVDNIFSEEEIAKYQDTLDKLLGYRVDMNKLTVAEQIKVGDELRNIQMKEADNYASLQEANLEAVKVNSDLKLELTKLGLEKEAELIQNNDKLIMLSAETRLQHKKDMIAAEMGVAENAANLLSVFAEDSKDLMRASIIAESAIGIGKIVISTQTANQEALALYPNPLVSAPIIAMNDISAGLGIAANIAATAKALSKVGGGSADSGAANVSGGKAKFNIVGSSSSNQLAATIAQQQQQPVKAYVVGTDMTTQQALDRNIQNSATFL